MYRIVLALMLLPWCRGWERGTFMVPTELPRRCGETELFKADSKFVTKDTWPWLGMLYTQGNSATRCNAVLIHSEVALASATCIGTNTADDLSVQFSTESLPTYQTARVDKIDFLYQNNQINNIGMMKLASKIDFNKNVQPVCLWELNADYSSQLSGHIGLVVGSELSNVGSRFRIYQTPVSLAGSDDCSSRDKNYYENYLRGSICVLYRESTPCHYIGSMLIMPRLSSEGAIVWYLRALQTTRVSSCGNGVYTPSFDLAPHRMWVDSHFKKSALQAGCGRRIITETPLVVMGAETQRGDWPWHVAIYRSNSSKTKKFGTYQCGASLISTRVIITAAHCLADPGTSNPAPVDRIIVLLGKYNLAAKEDGTVVGEVTSTFIHEGYNGMTLANDIGLIVLAKPIEPNAYIQPVCLWDDASDTTKQRIFNKIAEVPGWGFDENDALRPKLRVAKIPIIEDLQCIRSNENIFSSNRLKKTFCAGYRSAGASVCNGDSGGGLVLPLKQNDQRDTYFLRGLVSLSPAQPGKRICDPNEYALFTDVAHFIPWIESKISGI